MYLASAGLGYMNWDGKDFEKMKAYVDRKNNADTYGKYCLLELNEWDWGTYKKNRNLNGCKPVVVYDPYGVADSVIRCLKPDFNFVRNFGGKSKR